MIPKWDVSERKYFDDVVEEITTILSTWYQWESLFNQNENRLNQLSKSGNLLFGSIERIFYRDVVLGICRLTDPEKQNKFQNITIKHFEAEAYSHISDIGSIIDCATTKSEPFRKWRDKRLAHIDANTGVRWHVPSGCDRHAVLGALQAIAAVLRRVSMGFDGPELLLGDRDGVHGDRQGCLLRATIRPQIERVQNDLWHGFSRLTPMAQ